MFIHLSLSGKIYDSFTFFNELEILKIRCEELHDLVDHFVLVEATQTFSGQPKPLYYEENAHLFEKYKDKIIHIVVDDFPATTGDPAIDNWAREEHQRNCILRGLEGCHPDDDIIFISDADEIPSRQAIKDVAYYFSTHNFDLVGDVDQMICELHMRLFLFHLNRENFEGWKGAPKAAPYWVVHKCFPHPLRIRHWFNKDLPKIYNGGFHFNSMGGMERVLLKWKSHSPEYDFRDLLKKCEEDKEFLNQIYTNDFSQYTPVPIDSTFPKYILENIDYFRSIGWIVD